MGNHPAKPNSSSTYALVSKESYFDMVDRHFGGPPSHFLPVYDTVLNLMDSGVRSPTSLACTTTRRRDSRPS